MRAATVDFKKCGGGRCTKCLAAKACDRRIIVKFEPDEPAVIEVALCNACGDCVKACAHAAIKIIDV